MRPLILLFGLLTGAVTAVGQTKPAGTLPATTQGAVSAFKSEEHRFRINYPASWESRESAGVAAFFAGPLHADGTRPVVQVTILPVPEKKEMDSKPLTLAALSEQMVTSLQAKVQDAEVDTVEDAKLAGGEAKRITYTGTFHDDTYKFVQTVCLREKQIFVVTYANLESHSESAAELVKGMLESFEFVGK